MTIKNKRKKTKKVKNVRLTSDQNKYNGFISQLKNVLSVPSNNNNLSFFMTGEKSFSTDEEEIIYSIINLRKEKSSFGVYKELTEINSLNTIELVKIITGDEARINESNKPLSKKDSCCDDDE